MSDQAKGYMSLVKRVGEYGTLAGFTAFTVALIINTSVFAGWGLNFLQLASVGDVLFSAASVAFLIAPGIPLFVIGVLLFALPFSPPRRRLVTAVASLGMVLVAIASQRIPPPIANYSLYVLFGWLTPSAIARFGLPRLENRIMRAIYAVASLALIPSMLYVLIASAGPGLTVGANSGLALEHSDCPPPSPVLWSGSRSVIARCSDGTLLVIVGPENVRLRRKVA